PTPVPHPRLDRPRRHRGGGCRGAARSRGGGRGGPARSPGQARRKRVAGLPPCRSDSDRARGQGGRGAGRGVPGPVRSARVGDVRRGPGHPRLRARRRIGRWSGRPDRPRHTPRLVSGPSPAARSTPEQPWPVRVVSDQIAAWIHRLGTVWVEGQITQLSLRPGTRTAFLTLRDPSVDNSLTLTCPPKLVSESPVPVTEGSRVVVRGTPRFYTGRGSFSLQVTEIRPVGVGELLA